MVMLGRAPSHNCSSAPSEQGFFYYAYVLYIFLTIGTTYIALNKSLP